MFPFFIIPISVPPYFHVPTLLSQEPFFSYSAHDPHYAFGISIKLPSSLEDQATPIILPITHEVQWVFSSANAVARPQLLDVVHSAVGIEQLIYLYAKVCVYSTNASSISNGNVIDQLYNVHVYMPGEIKTCIALKITACAFCSAFLYVASSFSPPLPTHTHIRW